VSVNDGIIQVHVCYQFVTPQLLVTLELHIKIIAFLSTVKTEFVMIILQLYATTHNVHVVEYNSNLHLILILPSHRGWRKAKST